MKRPKVSRDKRTPEEKATESRLKKSRHWLDCKECRINGAEVDGTIVAIICWECTAMKTASPEDLAPVAGKKYAQYKDSFARGWWKKIVFSGEHDGKTMYFSRGKEITKAEYKKLLRNTPSAA